MTSEEALAFIQECVRNGNVWFTNHALFDRMPERSVRRRDVYHAIETASSCEHSEDNKWKVEGEDLDQDPLTVIVAIEEKAIIITVF